MFLVESETRGRAESFFLKPYSAQTDGELMSNWSRLKRDLQRNSNHETFSVNSFLENE